MNKRRRILTALVGSYCLTFVLGAFGQSPPITAEVVDLPGMRFKYSAVTHASKEYIWSLWTDVENWQNVDSLIEYAFLDEGAVFSEGATGILKSRNVPRTKFTIIDLNEGESFTVSLHLPIGTRIEQKRYYESYPTEATTVFTHEIHFKGPLSPPLWASLNHIYRREMRSVVENLKDLAEQNLP